MTQPTQKQAKKAAIQLHSLIVRHNSTGCAAANVLPGTCGTGRQCAHIIPKKQNSWISTDLDNAWVLCDGHHRMVDSNPARWLELVNRTVGIEWPLVMQVVNDERRESLDVTPLRYWRSRALVMLDIAMAQGVNLDTIPVHIKSWATAQKAEQV